MTEKRHGEIRIANDVVAAIAGKTALEIPGIVLLSGGRSAGRGRKASGKNVTKGVAVNMRDGEAAIELRVAARHGEKIHEICRQLQENIKRTVEGMTGLGVTQVHVHVEDVFFEEREKPRLPSSEEN